jgi:hypothetical protein
MLLLTIQLDRLGKAWDPLWKQLKPLFTEHHFITVICGFFILLITISCYRFLKSISPALVGIVLMLMLFVLVLHWTQTRTEPAFLKGFVDTLAPFLPAPAYPIPPKH